MFRNVRIPSPIVVNARDYQAASVARLRENHELMRVLVTGICGFVGSTLALEFLRRTPGIEIIGVDNLSRPGSELNRQAWKRRGVRFVHGDIRLASDLEGLPAVDWVLDAAANPRKLRIGCDRDQCEKHDKNRACEARVAAGSERDARSRDGAMLEDRMFRAPPNGSPQLASECLARAPTASSK